MDGAFEDSIGISQELDFCAWASHIQVEFYGMNRIVSILYDFHACNSDSAILLLQTAFWCCFRDPVCQATKLEVRRDISGEDMERETKQQRQS